MRKELLSFIDESIGKHEEFLGDNGKRKKFDQSEKQRQEQILIDKGAKEKAISVAIKAKEMNLSVDQIMCMTGLTVDEINKI